MAFNISDFLNEESRKEIKSDWKPVKVSVRKLRPAPEKANFYHTDDKEIEDLARSIELVGLQQYPVIRPIEGSDEYEVVAGHKRRLAILKLLDENKTEYEMIPCRIETPDSIRNELILILTNSTQRERTDYEKMREVERVRELLTEYQKTHEITGRKQIIIADILGTSKTKVGTLDNINSNLIEPFKVEFAAGKISTYTANTIAGLDKEAQGALYDTYKETGTLTAKDVKALNGQQETPTEPPKDETTLNSTPKQEKPPETPQEHSTVTYNPPAPDMTDKKSLIINGRINMHKEYNGMEIMYFMEAVISTDLFDSDFWHGWKENTGAKWEYIADYAGAVAEYTFKGAEAEKCKVVLTDRGLEVTREAAGQTATILYDELTDLLDLMIYTKVIEITEIEADLKFWAARTVKELEPVSSYLTENEVYILQDLMMKCKERAGRHEK